MVKDETFTTETAVNADEALTVDRSLLFHRLNDHPGGTEQINGLREIPTSFTLFSLAPEMGSKGLGRACWLTRMEDPLTTSTRSDFSHIQSISSPTRL